MRTENNSRTKTILKHRMDLRLRLFLEGILIGLVSGIIVVLYRAILEEVDSLRSYIYSGLHAGSWMMVLLWFLILSGVAYVIGIMVKKEPMISGSGIPQVKGILIGQMKMNWLRIVIWKFIGGVLALGAGLSLGREGPSVQLGAAVGQGISRSLKRLKIEEKYLISSGASAGLAAAFSAPLAGVIFALEEMHKNFSPIVLTSAMAASLSADLLAQRFFGQKPVFNFDRLPTLPLEYFPYLIILGLIIGLFGVLFNYSLLKSLELYKKSHLPVELRPIIPFLIAGGLGFVLPDALGGGHNLINSLGAGNIQLLTLVVLVTAKFLFTMVSYGSGVPGGIFLPLLVIGALTGDIFGQVVSIYLNVDPMYVNNFIILSMAAYFTAIVKAPITGSILITEMTGSFSHLLAMATVSMIAYIVTDIAKSKPVYDLLLERTLKNSSLSDSVSGNDSKKVIIEIPVCLSSRLERKRVRDIEWPKDCLLVGLKRGEMEIIPKGNTLIMVGDYLIALTNDDKETTARNALEALAKESDNTKGFYRH